MEIILNSFQDATVARAACMMVNGEFGPVRILYERIGWISWESELIANKALQGNQI